MYARSGLLKGTGLHLSEDITRKHKDKVNVGTLFDKEKVLKLSNLESRTEKFPARLKDKEPRGPLPPGLRQAVRGGQVLRVEREPGQGGDARE